MTAFVDPRANGQPPCRVSRDPAAEGSAVHELIRLCAAGEVYATERWIQNGNPIQAYGYGRSKRTTSTSPLRMAIRKGHRDIVLLLLCNGYRLELEPVGWASPLSDALSLRDLRTVDLLLTWGADPTSATSLNVIDTYMTELIDRFWRAGLDYTEDAGFIEYLAHTANKPLYGWMRRHRSDQRLQDALDVALLQAVEANAQRSLHLLVWAGANAHRPVPSARDWGRPEAWSEDLVSSAAELAIALGRREAFKALRVAELPNLEGQLRWAHDPGTLQQIVDVRPPADWSEVILTCIRWSSW